MRQANAIFATAMAAAVQAGLLIVVMLEPERAAGAARRRHPRDLYSLPACPEPERLAA